jgi:hypothetical protein
MNSQRLVVTSRERVFVTAAVGVPLLVVLGTLALMATDLDLLGLIGPLVLGLLVTIGLAAWIGARRLSAAAAWMAGVSAALVYLVIVVGVLAVGLGNAELR